MKVLGVTLDRHLTFEKHVSVVARSCNYHNQATRHIRHLLTTQLAQTPACGMILSRLDYCNAVLHGIPPGNIQKLQRVQNSAAWIVLQAPHQATTTPAALAAGSTSNHVQVGGTDVQGSERTRFGPHRRRRTRVVISGYFSVRILRSTTTTRLSEPFASTAFAKSAFRCSAPAIWNSPPRAVTDNDSLGTFKSRLKIFLFSLAFNWHIIRRQRLWSYDLTALYKSIIINVYLLLNNSKF